MKEALKLALEALKMIDEAMPFPVAKLAQTAIKEALAQDSNRPVESNYTSQVAYTRALEAYCDALAQPKKPEIIETYLEKDKEQEPVTIWYMRDNHTFKKLSAHVSEALIEIEQEFNMGYTYGMLCSKRKFFPTIHASGEKKRLEFFDECKKTLEEWLPNAAHGIKE